MAAPKKGKRAMDAFLDEIKRSVWHEISGPATTADSTTGIKQTGKPATRDTVSLHPHIHIHPKALTILSPRPRTREIRNCDGR